MSTLFLVRGWGWSCFFHVVYCNYWRNTMSDVTRVGSDRKTADVKLSPFDFGILVLLSTVYYRNTTTPPRIRSSLWYHILR